MRYLVVLAVVALGGCADVPAGPVDGTWASAVNDDCADAITFDSRQGVYARSLSCRQGSEVEAGKADFSQPGRVALAPGQTSCPDSAGAGALAVAVVGGQLMVDGRAYTDAATFYANEPHRVRPAGVEHPIGCWSMGQFKPHSLVAAR